MRAVQFDEFGPPEVLHVAEVPEPHAGPDQIRIVVRAVGINPMDWKIRSGAMGEMPLPQGMGAEAAGVVDEVGDAVTTVTAGDAVFGPTSDGAADFALMSDFAVIPARLEFAQAAALPVAVETALRGLDLLEVASGDTLLVNGGGGAVGAATVQFALQRGARVVVTASEANAERLRGYGAEVTPYGDGLAERVAALAGTGSHPPVDRVFDMSPGGALEELIAIAGGDPRRVLTITDFAGAGDAGVLLTGGPGTERRWDALDHAATLAQEGRLEVPVAQTFTLEDVAEAEAISEAGHVRGKLVLLVD